MQNLRQIREALQLSRKQVAALLGCCPQYVAMLERGERSPSGATRRLIEILKRGEIKLLSEVSNA